MNIKAPLFAIATSLLITAAWAQTSAPLNLKLPANAPASSSTSAHASTTSVAANGSPKPASSSTAPGAYYGDTSGRTTDVTPATTDAGSDSCDDYKYSRPQVHGDVGVGVVSGSRIGTGSYTGGDVSVTQNLGSCDHPTGAINISVGATRFGGFNGH